MKVLIALAALLIVGCSTGEKKGLNMPGAYQMISQSIKGDQVDTTYTSIRQLKIFTDKYVMYCNVNVQDSTSSFGFGTYKVDMDTVREDILFTSNDTVRNETERNYQLTIEKDEKGFSQIIPAITFGTQTVRLTEKYESVGTAAKSDLDGAWKLTKVYMINGSDTATDNRIQYKAYYAGYCIWGNSFTDSLNINRTGIGFGKFEMEGKNKVKEKMQVSSYSTVSGHDFDIAIEMNGIDEFTQTITNDDGSKSVEMYQRLK
jgi:hypothetical protein